MSLSRIFSKIDCRVRLSAFLAMTSYFPVSCPPPSGHLENSALYITRSPLKAGMTELGRRWQSWGEDDDRSSKPPLHSGRGNCIGRRTVRSLRFLHLWRCSVRRNCPLPERADSRGGILHCNGYSLRRPSQASYHH